MTDRHFANFIAGIRKGEKLNAPIAIGNVAVTMLQLSNVAWEVKRELQLDTKDGRIQGDAEAMQMPSRVSVVSVRFIGLLLGYEARGAFVRIVIEMRQTAVAQRMAESGRRAALARDS